ncbi:zinc finger protein Eos isoform X2 [Polypterus senegalus]|uniref:zinc finger protein Eos isoform X2 n=1 Tax=Polypterus senegalus TaxID=55291 RepID=UPI0019631FB7|nr:zinc finger protein Eos isoform X2 [Polypterus senegalus]
MLDLLPLTTTSYYLGAHYLLLTWLISLIFVTFECIHFQTSVHFSIFSFNSVSLFAINMRSPAYSKKFQGSGDSSLEKDFSGAVMGPTVSTPNSQHSSPSRSLSANSIKVEMYSDEEPGRLLPQDERSQEREDGGMMDEGGPEQGGYCDQSNSEPISPGAIRLPNGKLKCDICGMVCIGPNVLMVHKRSHTGERPFQCNQCGASFTQKGNLLRHIKLHSGEKPFKCPFCSYACRRRDALTGHLRTHSVSSPTVGKPYKCSYCGRSYKQQSTLEEHRERCHSYLQSLDPQQPPPTGQPQDMRDLELMPDAMLHSSTERMSFIDRLANSITKRKRSTPQKFVGEKHMRLNMSEIPFEMNCSFEKDELIGSQHSGVGDAAGFGGSGAYLGGGCPEPLRPLRLPPPHSTCLSDMTPVISSVYTQLAPLRARLECPGGMPSNREAGEGHEDLQQGRSLAASPSNGCHDSTDTESVTEDHNHQQHQHQRSSTKQERQSPGHAKEDCPNPGPPSLPASTQPVLVSTGTPTKATASSPAKETVRVVDGEGQTVRTYKCEHCRILFLDHVMFTIHMGCHGFRDPFECNICGYHSQDRYEFSSHIVRGEHKVG